MEAPKERTKTVKKKVLKRIVKNAKTGEIIKTDILGVDENGKETILSSYPAGTSVPDMATLGFGNSDKKLRKSEKRRPSQDVVSNEGETTKIPISPKPEKKVDLITSSHNDTDMRIKDTDDRMDIGPSVPTNMPGLDDLIKLEEKMKQTALEQEKLEKPAEEESIEAALINILRRKRKDPLKSRRRGGLNASTLQRHHQESDEEEAGNNADRKIDTDYREELKEDEEAETKRKEKHRRRRDKRPKDKPRKQDTDTVMDNDGSEEFEGEPGPLNMPVESSKKRTTEEEQIKAEQELLEKMEGVDVDKEAKSGTPQSSDDSSDDGKKKKKKKHKKQKKRKKKKKDRRRDDYDDINDKIPSDEGLGDEKMVEDEPLKKKEEASSRRKDDDLPPKKRDEDVVSSHRSSRKDDRSSSKYRRSRSRSNSPSNVSVSSMSSAFSDSFDFDGMNFDPSEDVPYEVAMGAYQNFRQQQMFLSTRGRGGRGGFRGRGNFRGRGHFGRMGPFGRGGPPIMPLPDFGPEFYKNEDEAKRILGVKTSLKAMEEKKKMEQQRLAERGRGRGRGANRGRGPWWGRGKGLPPGFHFGYTEDEDGAVIYEGESSGSERRRKKKKHRRSYSSYSSYSSDSRSRSRRRHYSSDSYSSRSYSSRSRSYSRSRSKSRSRSGSSYSRSRSRSASGSRSYSSRSNSRSKSRSRSRSKSTSSDEKLERRASPSYHAIIASDPVNEYDPVDPYSMDAEDEVPWWATFDKTYEIEKQKKEEEQRKIKEGKPLADASLISTEDVDIVRCVMQLVEKATSQQDEYIEGSRECVTSLLDKVCAMQDTYKPTLQHEVNDFVQDMLDKLTPNDDYTLARKCINEVIDTIVEQEAEDEEVAKLETNQYPNTRLWQCYNHAQKLTEKIRSERRLKKAATDLQDNIKKIEEDQKKEKKDYKNHKRRRRRGRKRGRSSSRSRSRSYSSRSRSSSEDSTRRGPLTTEESLKRAQELLLVQQQKLQSLLGKAGLGNLSTLNEAAALAAGITSSLGALTGTTVPATPESIAKSNRWDKDKDAMLKTKSKDDLTRKLMQRMREKKLNQEDEEPTFIARAKPATDTAPEKVFTNVNLKSRKIAISTISSKLNFTKDGSPAQGDDDDEPKLPDTIGKFGYTKSEIVAAASEKAKPGEEEKTKALENERKLAMWAEEQARLKEAAKKEMRDQIERAERQKKEKLREELLEKERVKEIARIREEVRNQIRKEIQEEIEKQKQSVMEDPQLRGQLLELEALRSHRVKIHDNVGDAPQPVNHPHMQQQDMIRELERKDAQYNKYRQDMSRWNEQRGMREWETTESEMRRAQLLYMTNWPRKEKEEYMNWFWNERHQPRQQRLQYMQNYYQQQQKQKQLAQQQQQAKVQQPPSGTSISSTTNQPPSSNLSTVAPSQQYVSQAQSMTNTVGATSGSMAATISTLPMSSSYGQVGQPITTTSSMKANQQAKFQQQQNQQSRGQNIAPQISAPPYNSLNPDPAYQSGYQQQNQPGYHSQTPHSMVSQSYQPQTSAPQQPNPTDPNYPVSSNQQSQYSSQQHMYYQQQSQQAASHHQAYHGSGIQQQQMYSSVPPHSVQQIPSHPQYQQQPYQGQQDPNVQITQAQDITLQQSGVPTDQPLPPGESPAPTEELAPPGEERRVVLPPEEESPSKSKKKKKHKKQKKSRKKKASSSEAELDEEEKKKAILSELSNLEGGVKPFDVEDGEIASGAEQEKEEKEHKKKKHKKEKKKKKKRSHSTDDERDRRKSTPSVPNPQYQIPSQSLIAPHQAQAIAPPQYSYPTDPNIYPPMQPPPAFQPAVTAPYQQAATPLIPIQPTWQEPPPQPSNMGPDGDHLVIPHRHQSPLNDAWKIDNRYQGNSHHEPPSLHVAKDTDSRLAQGEGDFHSFMHLVTEEENRRRGGHEHLRQLPRHRSQRGRKRRGRRPYHDWDKPDDDGMIYYSGEDSGSEGGDFDHMLAKKRRNADHRDGRPPPPIHHQPPQYRHREKPQGIPVIGGGGRPIPSTSVADRGGRHSYAPRGNYPPEHGRDHHGMPVPQLDPMFDQRLVHPPEYDDPMMRHRYGL